MAEVQISLNGRIYRLSCEDGEQDRFEEISEYVSAKVEDVINQFGQVGQERILLLTALMLTDELIDACEEMQETTEQNRDQLKSLAQGGKPAGGKHTPGEDRSSLTDTDEANTDQAKTDQAETA
jgi:cell division protein ZapA